MVALSTTVAAQQLYNAQIKVWGNCGMCKKTIETAAKNAGASTANWSEDAKILAVSYDSSKTDGKKIQKAVAESGYDTQDFTAPKAAYDKLPGCCQYDRKPGAVKAQLAAKAEDVPKCHNMVNSGKSSDCCTPSNACCKEGKCEQRLTAGAVASTQSCCKEASSSCCKS